MLALGYGSEGGLVVPLALMATKKEPEPATPKPNREQRRRAKFGNAGNVTRHDPLAPWPESEANPAFGRGGDDQEAYTGGPDQDVTRQTGTGTGGATEGSERVIDREGIHGSNTQKG
jgi:hypothetical protein